jgi:hypothetical protein
MFELFLLTSVAWGFIQRLTMKQALQHRRSLRARVSPRRGAHPGALGWSVRGTAEAIHGREPLPAYLQSGTEVCLFMGSPVENDSDFVGFAGIRLGLCLEVSPS